MIFWSLAFVVTAIACAALYYAGAGRRVNALPAVVDSPEIAHLKLQLKEIESDLSLGRLGTAEAVAAKGELARELMRLEGDDETRAGWRSATRHRCRRGAGDSVAGVRRLWGDWPARPAGAAAAGAAGHSAARDDAR